LLGAQAKPAASTFDGRDRSGCAGATSADGSSTVRPAAEVKGYVDRVIQILQPDAPNSPVPSRHVGDLVLQQLHNDARTDVVQNLATQVATTVQRELVGQTPVSSGQIAAETSKILSGRDQLVYLRYASTVERYQSVDGFWRDILGMQVQSH
jgi:transcriptional regulator NrdR family protein